MALQAQRSRLCAAKRLAFWHNMSALPQATSTPTAHHHPMTITMANNRAEAAYINQHAAALYTLNELESIIEDMPAPDGETRINWGHVGSLVEINEQLGHLLRFAAGN